MRIDPIDFLVTFLRAQPGIPGTAPKGDLTNHAYGDTTVYLEPSGGFRMVRDRMDRVDIEYDVYSLNRKACIDLALTVREALLEILPNKTVDGALVLDTEDIQFPTYYPDKTSREHVYGGEVSVFFAAE
ncbi:MULTISPECIES: hypothetical protein [unclassified Streptomyces]|uniref:hypothetical protein n=1 Tax=unclassified Streptomyces TaxID=2593676 RepID=UPI00081F6C70|nr:MULTISPECIES: hypothetical protein [unclassified Streptomyces]MYR95459.1 hypothetical protein [Streptomyces sp. SID4937]SCD90757.1 hypothetical protein GA0115243_104744 [Streptomyces sp. ScaeMP-e83]